MILTTPKRIFKTGFVNFWRNGFLSFTAIVILTITLLSFGALIFAGAFGQAMLKEVKSQVDINIYFSLSASEQSILALRGEIDDLAEVDSTVFVSRDQALADFQTKWQNNTLIMQGLQELGSNPFPASLNVKAKDPGQYGGIANYLENKSPTDESGAPIIDKINYQENKLIIDRLGRIIPAVEQTGIIITIIFAIVAVVVVFNTIRLITFTARDEISVMKLVGASNIYVRGPLVISGMMYGIVAGIIALIVIAAVAYWSDALILRFAGVDTAANFAFAVNVFSDYFTRNFGQLFGIILGSGIILGGISSYIAARRYLRV
ncbi:MAG: permease-like cell division protein FtsX [Candidatus Paceibacterota bacterium]